jgi:hypothetical protein
MKRFFFVITIWIAFAAVPLFAQEDGGSLYYVNVPIVKVYPYTKGYVVTYNIGTRSNRLATAYLPAEWFAPGGLKGEVVDVKGTQAPSLTVVYRDGAFDHVKLYVRRDRRDASWGYMPLSTNIDDRFEDVTDLTIEY